MTRREKCYLVGKRALLLTPAQAVKAWYCMSETVLDHGHEQHIPDPKFRDLIRAVRVATIKARKG